MAMRAALVCLVLQACTSYVAPAAHLASATAAARVAHELGSEKVPTAELHVRLAEEALDRAKALMAEGKNERADYMTLRAYNDAELALALLRENGARLRAEEAAAKARAAGATP